ENDRLGQKNDKGFYKYSLDKKGKKQKAVDEKVEQMLGDVMQKKGEFTDEESIERMMVPLCIETVRCLEDGIVETAAEADMGLVYGIGFPPFRGGALFYIDTIGVEEFCRIADKYKSLGKLYHPTDGLREMAKSGKKF